jgi:hypothetical protein
MTGSARAHHSRAAYDSSTEIDITGVVANVAWTNPHIYIVLDVAGAAGPAQQQIEVGPLSTLGPLGLSRSVLTPGERVTVRANPNRKGPGFIVVGLDVTKSDGSIYPLHVFGRNRPAPAAQKAESLAGNWVPTTEGWREMVRGASAYPLSESGRKIIADVQSQLASQAECAPWPAPLLMGLPALRTIDVGPDVVTMRFDWMSAERTVHMNLAKHPANLAPSLHGHSIGHWEGGTLVIDTVGFAAHREGAGFGVPAGEKKHLTERLTLRDDRTSLDYQFTVEDPLSLTAPVTHKIRWIYRPDLASSGQTCDPEVAKRALLD